MTDKGKPVYPEHEKLRMVWPKIQAIGCFLDWLGDEKRWFLAAVGTPPTLEEPEGRRPDIADAIVSIVKHARSEIVQVRYTIPDLLAEFFGIDQEKLEAEKLAMLAVMRGDEG